MSARTQYVERLKALHAAHIAMPNGGEQLRIVRPIGDPDGRYTVAGSHYGYGAFATYGDAAEAMTEAGFERVGTGRAAHWKAKRPAVLSCEHCPAEGGGCGVCTPNGSN